MDQLFEKLSNLVRKIDSNLITLFRLQIEVLFKFLFQTLDTTQTEVKLITNTFIK
jgi:hypothetical protein